MAIYNLTSRENYYDEVKSAIALDNNLELKYDDGISNLVVKHLGLNIYIEFYRISSNMTMYVSSNWVSGANVAEPRFQLTFMLGGGEGKLIVNPNYMAISSYVNTGYSIYSLFTRDNNGDVVVIGNNGTVGSYYSKSYNITKAETINQIFYAASINPVINGKYAKMDFNYFNTAGDIVGIDALKILLRPANVSLPIEGVENHLVLNASRNSSGNNISNSCILGEGMYI